MHQTDPVATGVRLVRYRTFRYVDFTISGSVVRTSIDGQPNAIEYICMRARIRFHESYRYSRQPGAAMGSQSLLFIPVTVYS